MIDDLAAANDQGMRSPIAEAFEPLRNGFQLFAQFPIWKRANGLSLNTLIWQVEIIYVAPGLPLKERNQQIS